MYAPDVVSSAAMHAETSSLQSHSSNSLIDTVPHCPVKILKA
jgi:hypothetical protein